MSENDGENEGMVIRKVGREGVMYTLNKIVGGKGVGVN